MMARAWQSAAGLTFALLGDGDESLANQFRDGYRQQASAALTSSLDRNFLYNSLWWWVGIDPILLFYSKYNFIH